MVSQEVRLEPEGDSVQELVLALALALALVLVRELEYQQYIRILYMVPN